MSLSAAPEDVPLTRELLRAQGASAEFDENECPKIESAVQHRKIAQTLGLFTRRDGYGHQSVSYETRVGRLEWPHKAQKAQGGKTRE
jgi:hypothetical protein